MCPECDPPECVEELSFRLYALDEGTCTIEVPFLPSRMYMGLPENPLVVHTVRKIHPKESKSFPEHRRDYARFTSILMLEMFADCRVLIHVAKIESCFSSRLEENFMARLSSLHRTLKKVDVEEIRELVSSLTETRKALTTYEDVSDDGRLEEAEKIWDGRMFDDDLKYEPEEDWSDGGGEEDEKSSKAAQPTASSGIDALESVATDGPSIRSTEATLPAYIQEMHSATSAPRQGSGDGLSTDEVDDMVDHAISGAIRVSPSPEL